MDIIDHNGEKWVTVRQLGAALGYEKPLDIRFVIDRNPLEFHGKVMVCKLHTINGDRDTRIINYHGVIRAAMLSNAPRAIEFRDWAETVLFDVMTKGYHVVPTAESSIYSIEGRHRAVYRKI